MEREKLSFDDCLKDAQRLGYAEADPTFDIEGHDTAQKLVDPGEPGLRHPGRSGRDLCRRHLHDHAGRSRRRRRARLPHQAARRRGEDRAGHRAARASDHGAEGLGDRPGAWRHQRGDDRRRGIAPITLVGPGRRRQGDGLGGGRRHRRHRARRAHRAVRPAAWRGSPPARRRRCSATRAATTSACSRSTSPAPPPPSPSGSRSSNISMESIVQRHRGPHAGGAGQGVRRRFLSS